MPLVGMLFFFFCWSVVAGWTQILVTVTPTSRRTSSFALSMAKDELPASEPGLLERVSITGVSVSLKGFHVLMDTTKGVLPMPITRDPQDSYAATSPESLTIIQLLSGVDMAGAILPPETLAKMVVMSCELLPEFLASPVQCDVLAEIQKSLPKDHPSFSEAHPWVQSRVSLPQVTLDQLTLRYEQDSWQCQLECALKDFGPMSVSATPEIVQPVCYQYESDTSALFTCLALALRYRAPIAVENLGEVEFPHDLDKDFPQRTTVAKLQKQSTRVTQNIERGFEIHKLQGALQIAMKMGDQGAVERIRAKLDEFDSMDDLPTTSSGKEYTAEGSDDESLDDIGNNILQ